MILIVIFVLAHTLADFCFQSHWMASNKSSNNIALGLHVAVYTWTLLVIFVLYAGANIIPLVLLNGILHFGTDYYTSRWTSALWKQNRIHDFFVVIGLDQCIHYLTWIGLLYIWGYV